MNLRFCFLAAALATPLPARCQAPMDPSAPPAPAVDETAAAWAACHASPVPPQLDESARLELERLRNAPTCPDGTYPPGTVCARRVANGWDGTLIEMLMHFTTPHGGAAVYNARTGVLQDFSVNQNGHRAGPRYSWWSNGGLHQQGAFDANGLPDGVVERYYPDGRLWAQGNFSHGLADGEFTFWYPTGKTLGTVPFRAGHACGPVQVFHPDGKPACLWHYDRGVPVDGTVTELDPAGAVRARYTITGGRIEGPVEIYCGKTRIVAAHAEAGRVTTISSFLGKPVTPMPPDPDNPKRPAAFVSADGAWVVAVQLGGHAGLAINRAPGLPPDAAPAQSAALPCAMDDEIAAGRPAVMRLLAPVASGHLFDFLRTEAVCDLGHPVIGDFEQIARVPDWPYEPDACAPPPGPKARGRRPGR